MKHIKTFKILITSCEISGKSKEEFAFAQMMEPQSLPFLYRLKYLLLQVAQKNLQQADYLK